jgi:hypothetical protein
MGSFRHLSKSAIRAASTSTAQTTKAAGDISSVFPSLQPGYQPEPLPARFQELKQRLFEKNEKALKESWKRLLLSLEEEAEKIKSKGSDVSKSHAESSLKTNRQRSFHL